MKLHTLAPKVPKKNRVRRGQGDAAGKGSFSGRGCKGQKARTGKPVRQGFEGGQSSLLMKMPKLRGFRNPTRAEFRPVNLDALEDCFKAGDKVTIEALVAARLIEKKDTKVKILGNGELTKKLEIAPGIACSMTARVAIEKAGGKVDKKEEKKEKTK